MFLGRVLAMAFQSVISDLHERLAHTPFAELRPAHGYVMLHVRENAATVQDIAELMGMTKQAASKLVATMESQELLARKPDPQDGRAWRLVLSARGHKALLLVESIYQAIEAEWAEVIGADAVTALQHQLMTVVRARCGDKLPPIRPQI